MIFRAVPLFLALSAVVLTGSAQPSEEDQEPPSVMLQCPGAPAFDPLAPMDTPAQVRALDPMALPLLEALVKKGCRCPDAAQARTVFLMRWSANHPDLKVEVVSPPEPPLLVPYLLSAAWNHRRAIRAEEMGRPLTRKAVETRVLLDLARMIRHGNVAGLSRKSRTDWPEWAHCRTEKCLESYVFSSAFKFAL
ncbi:MAG: hypothetical protein P8M07_04070 [Flavobacteriales bacterium]|nr:hypothetical protein [Flavobacteriales bacterium]